MSLKPIVYHDVADFQALLKTLRRKATKAQAKSFKPAPRSPEEAGGRNNYFTSLAGKLRRDGMDSDGILIVLREVNKTKGYDTPDKELVATAKSVGRYEFGEEGGEFVALERNVRFSIDNLGIRVDAAGRVRHIDTGRVADLSSRDLADYVWRNLCRVQKVAHEAVERLVRIALKDGQVESQELFRQRLLGKPASEAGNRELDRFVAAVLGTNARNEPEIRAGLLQFIWCVKRSLGDLRREHDVMPILYNRFQGTGKSTAVRRLVEPLEELVDDITVETLSDERKRGDLGRFVVGFWDEMEGADKKDADAIKRAITSQTVSYRPMGTNENKQVPRRMNFIGTSNRPLAGVIRDPSGNRRFIEIQTADKLDHEAINSIDYYTLWQAISETDAAPIKPYLGGIRTIQSENSHQDSVQMWLETEELVPGEWASVEEWRTRYTGWCERAGDQPMPSSPFITRLRGEGFIRERRTVEGKRPWGYLAPETGGVGTESVPPPQLSHHCPTARNAGVGHCNPMIDNIFIEKCPTVPLKSEVAGKFEKSPGRESGGTGGTVGQWPTPPGRGPLGLWVYDCEVFPNRFMFSAWNGSEWREFDETSLSGPEGLATWAKDKRKVFAGFNNHGYDDVILGTLVADARQRNPGSIYRLSTRIIEPKTEAERDANFKDRYKGRPWAYSIDVFQLLNAKGSLKEWECREGYATVVESPAPFDQPLADGQVGPVRQYCRNDVLATAQILTNRWHLVRLRETLAEQFNLGHRAYCLSEQGLAQATFLGLHKDRTGKTSGMVRKSASEAPENQAERLPLAELISPRVEFSSILFRSTLQRLRTGSLVRSTEKSWAIELDGAPLAEPFPLAGCELSLGVGGLHTVDKPGIITSDAETAIVDLDVTSYYPSLMIAERCFPSQIGEGFVEDLANLLAKRVAAKKAGDKTTSEALKIVLNSTFGKLNDNWSPIRSVSNAFRVTINGQLFLMMLMEGLHTQGFEILSANTDGVTIRAARHRVGAELDTVTATWQLTTGLNLEKVLFSKICRRDVNTYIAMAEDGKVKSKGAFNPESGKGDGRVIRDAAIAHLLHGVDPEQTVARETDPVAFLFYQRVKNGGDLHCGSQALGKTARWYASTSGQPIRRRNPKGTFDTIPNAHRAALALDIAGWTVQGMADLDLAYYVEAARGLIAEVK